jgi:hypothetical protein
MNAALVRAKNFPKENEEKLCLASRGRRIPNSNVGSTPLGSRWGSQLAGLLMLGCRISYSSVHLDLDMRSLIKPFVGLYG